MHLRIAPTALGFEFASLLQMILRCPDQCLPARIRRRGQFFLAGFPTVM